MNQAHKYQLLLDGMFPERGFEHEYIPDEWEIQEAKRQLTAEREKNPMISQLPVHPTSQMDIIDLMSVPFETPAEASERIRTLWRFNFAKLREAI